MGEIQIIEASAGSGKTHRLTLEYIKHLLTEALSSEPKNSVIDYRKIFSSILAITFTNKATEEMKERIIRYLKALALKENSELEADRKLIEDSLLHQSPIKESFKTPKVTSEKIGEIVENLFINYSDFNVKTIDSLMTSLIRVLSPELKLPPDTPIEIDFKEELTSFAREYLENLVNHNWELITNTITELITSGEMLGNTVDRSIITKLTEIFEKILKENIDIETIIPQSSPHKEENIKAEMDNAYTNYRKNLEVFYNFIQKNHSLINGNTVRENTIKEIEKILKNQNCNIPDILNLTDKRLFKIDIYTSENDFKLYKKGALNTATAIVREGREIFEKLLISQYSLIEAISRFKTSQLFHLLKDFTKKWEDRNNRTVYVPELSRILKKKLGNLYPYLKLSDKFIHFLFDEFQDTSELQFGTLSPLIDEVLASEERASFLAVGDKKQAIYRWRGGKSELMDPQNLRDYFSQGLRNRIRSLSLSVNYRSLPAIVKFNNAFWNPKNIGNSAEEDEIREAISNNFRNSFQECANKSQYSPGTGEGYVEITGVYQDKDENTQNILKQIMEYITLLTGKGYKPHEIAILVRKNEEIKNIILYLESNGFTTITDESLRLSSSPIINEIVSFMKFLEYPPDNLSFFTFITGEITSKILETNPSYSQFSDSIRKILEEGIDQPLYRIFESKYPKFWNDYVSYFYKSSGLIPPYDLFQDMTLKFKLYENFPELTPFLLKFSDLLHELEQKGITSISAFLEDWGKNLQSSSPYSIDSIQTEEAITIMTIHKAKGLDFPAVIVPILREKSNQENTFVNNGNLYYITKKIAEACPKLKEIYRKEYMERYIDTLNLLYVAFTRAKETLLIPVEIRENSKKSKSIIPVSSPEAYNIVLRTLLFLDKTSLNKNHIYNSNDYTIKEKLENLTTSKKRIVLFKVGNIPLREKRPRVTSAEQITEQQISHHFTSSKLKLTNELESNLLIFYRHGLEETSAEKEEGETLHRMLSQLEMYSEREQLRTALAKLCKNYNLSEEDSNRIISFILSQDVIRFYTGEATFKNEHEIIQCTNKDLPPERRRIDRLVITNDTIYILDYKFGAKERAHYLQLEEYTEILKDIYRHKKIEAYLLYMKYSKLERVV